jgi:uncharacterized protein YndB with AHSA1/START domain
MGTLDDRIGRRRLLLLGAGVLTSNQMVASIRASNMQPGGCHMSDRIEKRIELKAPTAKVWNALTDSREFGEWFGASFDGPFVAGRIARGKMTHEKYQHVMLEITIKEIEPQRLFSFTWHPYAVDDKVDYSQEPSTLVEFRLEPNASGTVLQVTESGFDKIPAHRRVEAFRMNDNGWTSQIKNIERHMAKQHA